VLGKKKKYPLEKKPRSRKYRLIITNDRTFEEKFSFSVSRLNAVILLASLGIIAIVAAFMLIIFTPLKEYVPGHESQTSLKEIYRLNQIADSLMLDLKQKNLYIENIRRIINNQDTLEDYSNELMSEKNYDSITLNSSKEDSIFRAEFENEQMFNLYFNETKPAGSGGSKSVSIRDFNFFTPLNGIITSHFDITKNHYGVDVVAESNEAVKATLSGTVVLSDWTLETGNILVIQHPANIVSVYKHCSALLVKEGNPVNAGDPIAITGQTGERQTGPHLHFEIWYNGTPANPEKYILFE
jgi:murein DD-endopeptidase MepM/ murein hydrolase activator NlpD